MPRVLEKIDIKNNQNNDSLNNFVNDNKIPTNINKPEISLVAKYRN